ncbi:MAG: protoheme IX farnesyltransferase [Bacteroidales bacterium]|nr:protoheme IX farnesyltransferase [Bacteroidales bacterium]
MKVWLQFIKYKLSLAVTITGITGFLISDGSLVPELIITSLGIFLLASGAAGLNQFQERKTDALMIRTASRPLPSGLIDSLTALIVSIVLIVTGSLALLYINITAALLGLLNILLYNFIYTSLKKVSYLAIIPGALVGALPPLIGWFAGGGSDSYMPAIYLATLIFLWQIPHFWLLIIKYHRDYERAGFPTILKLIEEIQVRRIVFVWVSLSSLFAISFFMFGINPGRIISYLIVIANIAFIILFYRLLFSPRQEITRAFIVSNIFISLIFLTLGLSAIL